MNKLRKNMGLSLFPLSFIFLFNPDITVFDILPDAIGYLIMMLALSNLSDIDHHIETAKNRFKLGALLSLCKLLSLLVLFGLVSQNDRSVAILTATFVFSTAELILLIPAYKELFEGLLNLGMLNEGTAVFRPVGSTNVSDRMLRRTVTFLIIKICASTLPEFTSLIDNTEYRFIGLLRGFGFIVALVFGIVWLISFIRYTARVRRDKQFISNLEGKFKAKLIERPNLFLKRKLIFGLSLIFGALIFSLDWYSDYYNIIPSFICSVLLFCAAVYLRSHTKKWRGVCAVSVLYGIVSLTSWIISIRFFNDTYPEAALKRAEIYQRFIEVFIGVLADALFFAVLILYLLSFLQDIASVHTPPEKKSVWDRTDECFIEFKKGSIILMILAVICGAITVFYTYTLPLRANVWYIEMAWIFAFVADVAFVSYAYHFIDTIKKEISLRYSLS